MDIPHSDDWEKYSDKLWKNAYERGKADRPQGKWIDKCGNKVCVCSSCGEGYDHTYEWIERWNYCPNCGAKMKGADDESSDR